MRIILVLFSRYISHIYRYLLQIPFWKVLCPSLDLKDLIYKFNKTVNKIKVFGKNTSMLKSIKCITTSSSSSSNSNSSTMLS